MAHYNRHSQQRPHKTGSIWNCNYHLFTIKRPHCPLKFNGEWSLRTVNQLYRSNQRLQGHFNITGLLHPAAGYVYLTSSTSICCHGNINKYQQQSKHLDTCMTIVPGLVVIFSSTIFFSVGDESSFDQFINAARDMFQSTWDHNQECMKSRLQERSQYWWSSWMHWNGRMRITPSFQGFENILPSSDLYLVSQMIYYSTKMKQ